MAVYTSITENELSKFLHGYNVGELRSYEGISEGVTNTNYHVFTNDNRYVLTLFEEKWGELENLEFYFSYSDYLSSNGIACPKVLEDNNGNVIGRLAGKKAALVSFLEGQSVLGTDIDAEHCYAMGKSLAKMHVASTSYLQHRENTEGVACLKRLVSETVDRADEVSEGLSDLITKAVNDFEVNRVDDLPAAIVHTDLFPDNVFFKGHELVGTIDFYFSCTDLLVYDLAIVVNAWCFDANGTFNPEFYKKMMEGYGSVRLLEEGERKAFSIFLQGAALRFLLTRLHDWLFNAGNDGVTNLNPEAYINILKFHQSNDITHS